MELEQAFSDDDLRVIAEKKLGNSTAFSINQHKLSWLSERVGLLGEHAVLQISATGEGGAETTSQLSFFAKFFPKFEAQAKFAERIGAFKKEIFVYELLARMRLSGVAAVADVTCHCYLTKFNNFIILDNLMEKGFTALDKHEYLDVETIKTVLSALAKLHASSLVFEEKQSAVLGQPYRLQDDFADDLSESFFNDSDGALGECATRVSIECVLKQIDIFHFETTLLSGRNFRDVLEALCYEVFQLVKPSTKHRNVLCHGDLWATNFLIKGRQCKFVDFQCGRYCPPAHDVMSVFYLTTSREFRSNNMYHLIGGYYNDLEKQLSLAGHKLVDLMPFGDFLQSCAEQKVFALIQTALYFPLILISNDAIEKYFSDEKWHQMALVEDRSALVLEHMNKDEKYTRRLKEALQDLKDYCDYLK